ncbi:unnamed protein product [Cuscuta campestris]|uniref:Uncharacterized protein n=1 Tax=Cuscuta campestris TaxID=132261 RepID=A0A484K9S4_9ASTE|nr:unnamed protein product [Cuscuta campestris]
MHAFRLLRSIPTRPLYSTSRAPYDGKFGGLIDTWTKRVKPQVYNSLSMFSNRFGVRSCHWQFSKLKNRGDTFTLYNAVGLSALLGSLNSWRHDAYAMDEEFGALLDDGYKLGLLENPKTKKDHRVFLVLLKKLVVPIFLVVTIFLNWGHPLIIVAKVTLTLYVTKPSPLSIYFFVEESLHANKVEVEDYGIFCLADVELKDQKLTVFGFLGSWWVLHVSSPEEGFSALKSRFRNIMS